MRYRFVDIIISMAKTIFLLLFLEIVATSVLPAFGLTGFKLAFNVLIILFLTFKIEAPFLPFLILVIQIFHSAFSIEGWAVGTLAGLLIAISMKYLRELLEFSSKLSTVIVVQIFQIAWFFIINLILCLKLGDFSTFFSMTWGYIPPSIILSIISPFFFSILDRFWKVSGEFSARGKF